MQNISDIAKKWPASGIRAMFDIAVDYPDAINLCNGEPNFDTPEHIKRSAIRAIEDGFTKYGVEAGLYELREAVANKYTKQFNIKHSPENVMVTAGGVEALLLSLMTIINPGDEVIIPDPAYTSYFGQVELLKGKVVRVPLYEKYNFKLQPEDLEKAITAKTKAIIITYPSNPLGAVLEKEDAEKLAEVIERHNIIVISDEVYEKIVFDGREHFSLAQIPSIKDKVLITNSLSKTYAMTGWRVGYVVGNEKIMSQMFKLQQSAVSCLPIFIQKAAVEAINGPQDAVYDMVAQYEKRRNILVDGLSAIDGIQCFVTQGSFCVFTNIKAFDRTSNEFAVELLKEAGVLSVPGTAFGEMGEGYVRFCFANSDDVIKEGVKRLQAYIPKIPKRK